MAVGIFSQACNGLNLQVRQPILSSLFESRFEAGNNHAISQRRGRTSIDAQTDQQLSVAIGSCKDI